MTKRFFAIVNGAAGGGRCRSRFDKFLRRLTDAGFTIDVKLTEGPGHATELAHEAYERGERRFLAVGGDGTSYEVVNGLFPRDPADGPVELGMLPLGTGNSFLRDFGITTEQDALEALLHGRTRAVDVIRCEHAEGTLHYINLLGLGFTARAGALTNEKFKPLGPLGYVAAVLVSVARLEHPVDPIRVDGAAEIDERPAAFLCFSNSRYTGGTMMMAPRADVSDGALDIIRVGALSRAELVAQFPRIFNGTHVDHPLVEQRTAKRVDFVHERLQDCMIDGEILKLSLRSLEVLPGALQVIV